MGNINEMASLIEYLMKQIGGEDKEWMTLKLVSRHGSRDELKMPLEVALFFIANFTFINPK